MKNMITVEGERNYQTITKTVKVIKDYGNGRMHVMWNGKRAFLDRSVVNRMYGTKVTTLLKRVRIIN